MQKEWIVEMIEMKNFHVHLPNRQDGILGFTGEHQSRRLEIHLDEPGTWNYKLELAYEDGQKNILDLTTDENQLYVDLERAHLAQGGTVQAQIRGVRGEEICKSNVFSLQILPSIEASEAFSAVLPSEFEQIEQRITVLSQEAQESADIAEEAAAAAQTLILHSPIIQNGTWWVYDAEKAGYQDTGTQATGARGEMGKTGAQGAKGEKGEPGTNFVVLGQYATLDALQTAIPNPQPGWAYSVGTTTPYDIYIYSESGTWVNHGTLQGENATINGVNTLTITAGDKIALDQNGSVLTIKTVGAAPSGFGLGTSATQAPNSDANAIDKTGFYIADKNVPNNAWHYIIHIQSGDGALQIAVCTYSTERLSYRLKRYGVWDTKWSYDAPLKKNLTLYVSENGNDETGDGSLENPFRQVQAALNIIPKEMNAFSAKINIAEGNYDGFTASGFSNGDISIVGASKDTTNISGMVDIRYNSANMYIGAMRVVGNGSNGIYIQKTVTSGVVNVCIDGSNKCGVGVNGSTAFLRNVSISNATDCAVQCFLSRVEADVISGSGNACGFSCGNGSSGAGGVIFISRNTLDATTMYSKEASGHIIENSMFK